MSPGAEPGSVVITLSSGAPRIRPVVAGAGQRLFEHVDTSVLHFRLTDERRLENGSVILTYVPSDLSA